MEKKLMIIDDSMLDILLVQRTLEINNYTGKMSVAETVSDAISEINDSLENNKPLPDVILLDMFFARESGIDFLNYFENIEESLRANVKIAVISATSLLLEQENVLERVNVVRMVDKPFTYSQISDLI